MGQVSAVVGRVCCAPLALTRNTLRRRCQTVSSLAEPALRDDDAALLHATLASQHIDVRAHADELENTLLHLATQHGEPSVCRFCTTPH